MYCRGNYVPGMCYDETTLYQQHIMQAQQQVLSPSVTNGHVITGMMSPGMLNNEMLSPSGTPTRGSKSNSVRPSQPPPAPPSATNSSSRYVKLIFNV